MTDRQLVSFEYDDGTIDYLKDDDARKWMGQINSSRAMDWVHGSNLDVPEFERTWSWRRLLPTNWFSDEPQTQPRQTTRQEEEQEALQTLKEKMGIV